MPKSLPFMHTKHLDTWQLGMEALKQAQRLQLKWVGKRDKIDLAYVHDCILREYRAANKGTIRVSTSLLREMRAEMILVGKLRKILEVSHDR